MIITENKSKKVIQSHDFDQVNCTIDAEDMRYVASLLRNNYSDTRLAVVREISANALDANIEAGSTRPIEIKLPTKMNASFSVRDFGGGLSQEDVFGLYSKYGKSTKRSSNNYIGAFGIGKFAPLSYGDNFTCTSFHNGMKISYNVFVDENDDTKIVKLLEEPSDEVTGLEVGVAVAENDIDAFKEVTRKFFRFFSEEDMPKFLGVEDDFISTPEKLLASKGDEWFISNEENKSYSYRNQNAHVIMGRVAYPLNPSSISVENYISDESVRKIVEQLLHESNFYIRLPLGAVRLHHSRESLEYNKATQKEICRAFYKASQGIQEIAKEKLADSQDLFEAKKNYALVVNALPYQLRRVFENSFEWNGIKIDSPYFNRNYSDEHILIITEYRKETDQSSRNGFKVRASKVSRLYCQDNSLMMIQNIPSSHGNNLRVRTLMNEDQDLEIVTILHPTDKQGEDLLYNEWNFNLIDAKYIRYSDNVEKEKIVRNKVSGTSRASIPLFKMNLDKSRYNHTNASYWGNVTDPINSLELDNVEGSVNGKIIYVPIKNYKIDSEDYDLDRVYKIARGIRNNAKDNSDEKNLQLFGVRASDVKKLDKSTWVSFFDFYVDYCKSIIKSNKKECVSIYKMIEFEKSSNGSLDNYNWSFGQLFINKSFDVSSLGNDHLIMRCQANWKLLKESFDHDRKFQVAINVVRLSDKAWLENFFNVKVDAESILKDFKLLEKNYPLLIAVANQANHWVDLNRENDRSITNAMILDYISLCDNRGEGES